MKYSEASIGRILVVRLEDGDKMPDSLEKLALDKNIERGFCIFLGGIQEKGKIVVGPENGEEMPPKKIIFNLRGVHEVVGIGTLFPDEKGKIHLHAHASLGREGSTVTGCIREGITTWKIVEIILFELKGNYSLRLLDEETGFLLLDPNA